LSAKQKLKEITTSFTNSSLHLQLKDVYKHPLASYLLFYLEKFELTKPEDYAYLLKSGCFVVDNVDDNEDFERVKSAMQTLEFTPDEQEGIMICLAAVLHIGNVTFKAKDKGEGCQVANPKVTQTISNLLSCPQAQLETCLCQRVNFIRGEKFIVPLNLNECADNRDALAKSMYPSL
jgi:myosin-7